MNAREQQTTLMPAPSFAPMQDCIFQRNCAWGQQKTGGGECDKWRQRKSILKRREEEHREEPRSTLGLSFVKGSGQSLSTSLTPSFRPSLGSLIDRVRVHHDSSSANFVYRQGAAAVTAGADIYFANIIQECQVYASDKNKRKVGCSIVVEFRDKTNNINLTSLYRV